jgi:8-oxo-dGTP diphosphatase
MPVPKHIVAVAGLVEDAQGRVLMIRSPRRDWEFPGGQVEEGEDLVCALQREILEETGIEVTVGKLAGVYSNVKSHIVMFDFLCKPVSGEVRTSPESLAVEWVEREEVLGRIIRPVIRDRMRDMLEFEGEIVYRSYEFDADEVYTEYTIHQERHI